MRLMSSKLTTFPASRYDDQVDSTVYALAWNFERCNNSAAGWIEYYKREAGLTSFFKTVRLKWTKFSQPSTVILSTGQMVNCDGNGIFEVPEHEAPSLMAAGLERLND